jgi:plastocyanin
MLTTIATRQVARIATVVVVCTIAATSASGALAAPKTHTVTIEGTQFVPEKLTVRRGDRVVWINKDPFPHTATGRIRGFDSHSIAPGSSWRYVAGKPGTLPYVCTFHPTMKGTLVIE